MPIAETSPEIAPLLLKEASRHGLKPFHVRKESVGLMVSQEAKAEVTFLSC